MHACGYCSYSTVYYKLAVWKFMIVATYTFDIRSCIVAHALNRGDHGCVVECDAVSDIMPRIATWRAELYHSPMAIYISMFKLEGFLARLASAGLICPNCMWYIFLHVHARFVPDWCETPLFLSTCMQPWCRSVAILVVPAECIPVLVSRKWWIWCVRLLL